MDISLSDMDSIAKSSFYENAVSIRAANVSSRRSLPARGGTTNYHARRSATTRPLISLGKK